ncbi:GWxTD domain-containing protein [Pontibacter sp. JH31]|uniref:GWxTD domain-containing protein n=2 Tax=Pontibacter aquaedesilientis TaxID=2766980 RepID=A0ABR7XJ65_9BACT|nr:GWxTD domain-containing protein [Pontibacter aquaedesilientis]
MHHAHYAAHDSLYLIFRFEDLKQLLDLQQSATRIDFVIRAGNTERDMLLLRDTVQITASHKVQGEGSLEVPVKIPANHVTAGNSMQVRLWLKLAGQERLGTSHRLYLNPEMLQKDYLMVRANSGRPVFRGFATTADKLVLWRSNDTTAQPLPIRLFNPAFQPALPPMSAKQEPAPASQLPVADTIRLQTGDTIRLQQEGLYLFGADMPGQSGLLVQEGAYPLVTRVQDLIPPLIYLTTSAERETLYSAKNQKIAVDNFWMRVAKDKSLARELIRTYYTRVENANRLYTSYKPGWATDRGMIYIVYGKPNNISVSGDSETWIYRESEATPYVKFVFTKKENNFTENHFELIRNREYEEHWYSTVAKWRAGITNL